MTSSTRCSGRRRARPLAGVLVLLLAAGCAHRAPAPRTIGAAAGVRPRVLLLPVDNLSATAAPSRELLGVIAREFGRSVDLVTGDELEAFLARHRYRDTSGIDAATARAAREELGADAVLISTLVLYRGVAPPMFGLSMRLVATADEPVILWMGGAWRSGDDAPGLLRLGIVEKVDVLRDRTVAELARDLAAYLDGHDPAAPCATAERYAPKIRFLSPHLEKGALQTVAVVPFLNVSKRRGAGEMVALEFVRHLVSSGHYRVLEPGVVRDYLLRGRVIMPGGVSLETTRLMVGRLGAELVLSGEVIEFDETAGPQGTTLRFSATLLDAGSGQVLWSTRSANRGDDGVFLFGFGRVRTAPDLACRMIATTLRELGRSRPTIVAWPDRGERDPLRTVREGPRQRPAPAPARPPDVADTMPHAPHRAGNASDAT